MKVNTLKTTAPTKTRKTQKLPAQKHKVYHTHAQAKPPQKHNPTQAKPPQKHNPTQAKPPQKQPTPKKTIKFVISVEKKII